MKFRQWIIGIVLLVLIATAIGGVLGTREPKPAPDQTSTPSGKDRPPSARGWRIDQRPLQTAKRMAAIASSPEEQALGREAMKVGDHEVDLAFFDALRMAQESPPKLSPEAKALADRKAKAEQALKEDQEAISQLTRKLSTAPDSQKDNLQDQIDVAKAQTDLDQDELDDATEDLEQAGGDPESKIKRLKAEYDAGQQSSSTPLGSSVNPHEQDYQHHTLLSVF